MSTLVQRPVPHGVVQRRMGFLNLVAPNVHGLQVIIVPFKEMNLKISEIV
jgi:hypothetical protein